MNKYKVRLLRHLYKEVEFEADSEEDAEDIAWMLTNDTPDAEFECSTDGGYDWDNLKVISKKYAIDFIVPIKLSVLVEADSKETARKLFEDGEVEYNIYEGSDDTPQITNIREMED